MNPQNTIDIDPITITSSQGKVSLTRRNVRPCKCASCRADLTAGRGFKFWKARLSEEEYGYVGYLCGACVGKFLENVQHWFWNKCFWMLQASVNETTHDGQSLAMVWFEHGMSGLQFALANGHRRVLPSGLHMSTVQHLS
jgi:hypothetical protein